MAKIKLGDATAPAPLVLTTKSAAALDAAQTGDIVAVELVPARPRAIVFSPPPDSPEAFANWLREDVIPKLAHLPPDDLAERVSRIVFEHEQKMFARLAYFAGRITGRLRQGLTTGHDKDLEAIRHIVTAPAAPAPTPAVVPIDPDANSQDEQPAAAPLGVKW